MLLENSCKKRSYFATWFWTYQEDVSKGQLIKENKPNEWTIAHSKPPIYVNCQESQVKIVDPLCYPYLLAVENLCSRYNLFVNDLHSLEKNVSLNVGDKVEVFMEQEVIPTAGIVKYKGNLPNRNGFYFGIEILVSLYYVCSLTKKLYTYVL